MNNPPPFNPPFQPPSKPIPGPPSPEFKGWVMVNHTLTESTNQLESMDESSGDKSSKKSFMEKMKGLVLGSSDANSSSEGPSSTPSTQLDTPVTSRSQSPPLLWTTPLHNYNLSTCIPKLITVHKPRKSLLPPLQSLENLPVSNHTKTQASTSLEETRPSFASYHQHHIRRPSTSSSPSACSPTFPWYQPSSKFFSPSTETVSLTDMKQMSKETILSKPDVSNHTSPTTATSISTSTSIPIPIPTLVPNSNSIPSATEIKTRNGTRKGEEQSLFSQAADAVGSAWYPDDPTCYLPHELDKPNRQAITGRRGDEIKRQRIQD